ncbi:MAG TPA: hypothetical protein VFG87_02300 [Amycolatopsis sp.]|nr:hypothetical protein [Amycolatopsis sp.]
MRGCAVTGGRAYRALLAFAVLLLVAGCAPRFSGLRLTITTGTSGAVYKFAPWVNS